MQYIVHAYGLRSRFDRLRDRGLLTKKELADRLGIRASTLTRWVKHGIIKAHGGSINVRTSRESGTSFIIGLPITAAMTASANASFARR